MRRGFAAGATVALALIGGPALAQHGGHHGGGHGDDHGGHQDGGHQEREAPVSANPAPAAMAAPETAPQEAPAAPADHAADRYFDPAAMAAARRNLRREHGGGLYSLAMLDLAERRVGAGDGYAWDVEAWAGGDRHRLVLKSEGEGSDRALEAAEGQVLYGRPIGPYFNLEAGLRQDIRPRPARTYLALGTQGVAPYWFKLGGAVFLSDHGELTARAQGAYDLRLTQRLILQPRAEANLAARSIPELGVGGGLSEVELGLRLRYEVTPRFAPYAGLVYARRFGAGAAAARAEGERAESVQFVAGLRGFF